MENVLPYHTQERSPDAFLLAFDMPEVMEMMKQQDGWKMGERNVITFLKDRYMKFVLIALQKQTEINFHQSGNLVSVQLIEGEVNFQTKEQSIMLKKENLLTFHANLRHTLIAIQESLFLLAIADTHAEFHIN